jgi:hypothetical protein
MKNDDHSTMTFEEFIQSTMRVIDRALAASRASENQMMRVSETTVFSWGRLSQMEGTPTERLAARAATCQEVQSEIQRNRRFRNGNCRIPAARAWLA